MFLRFKQLQESHKVKVSYLEMVLIGFIFALYWMGSSFKWSLRCEWICDLSQAYTALEAAPASTPVKEEAGKENVWKDGKFACSILRQKMCH